jgi:hypothetical protein
VAVVSISRIQLRRGRKNQGSGLPQLASGEMGWAIDSQELFIGNGAVSEGAPYVGNTKILTEHDNIFEYALNYTYRSTDGTVQTGDTVTTPVQRNLQSRLDDIVSVRSFGAIGDGTDQGAALQRAIDQLYINPANKTSNKRKVILHIEAGDYSFNEPLKIPPYANIVGAGPEKTFFNYTGTGAAIRTVNEDSTPGSYASDATSSTLNQPRYINLEGISIIVPSGVRGIELNSCRDSEFKDLVISGQWENTDSIVGDDVGIKLNALSTATSSNNNKFTNIRFRNQSYGVYSDFDIKNNTWEDCKFENLAKGVVFGSGSVLGTAGQLTGPIDNTVRNSVFSDIDYEAFIVESGTGNSSVENKYYSIGNDGGTTANVKYSVIRFNEYKNYSLNDWFERSEELGYEPAYLFNTPYLPEVEGNVITDSPFTHRQRITEFGSYVKLFRLPANTAKSFEIDYLYKSREHRILRQGTLDVIVNPEFNEEKIVDEFDYTGEPIFEESLRFLTQNYDESGTGTVDTIAIMVLNLATADDGDLLYRIKTKG